jgi:hypothetical protein
VDKIRYQYHCGFIAAETTLSFKYNNAQHNIDIDKFLVTFLLKMLEFRRYCYSIGESRYEIKRRIVIR